MFRSSISVRRSPLLIRSINSVIGTQQLLIPEANLRIPSDVKEQISEEFGGLLQFARAHPLEYSIGQQGRIFTIKRSTPKTPTKTQLKFESGGRPVVLPHFAVPIPVLASLTKSTAKEIATGLIPLIHRKEIAVVGFPEQVVDKSEPTPWTYCVVPNETVVQSISSSSLDPAFARFEIQEYNICRASRFLNCDEFTPLQTWMKNVTGIVTQHPALIALSAPHRFEINYLSESPAPSNQYEEDFLSVLSQENVTLNTPQGVKYVVSEEGLGEAKVSEKYEESTIAELEAEMRNLHANKNKGFKVIKERRKLIKALLRKRFPNGSPLWDPDVTAYLVYDLMQPLAPGFHRTMKLRELLPEGGRICCSTNNDFFERFPHLFHSDELSRTDMVVMRADSGDKPVKKELTDVDVQLAVVTALPHPIQPGRPFSASHLAGKLTAQVIAHMKRVWGSPTGLLKAYPDVFQFVGDDMFLSTDTKVEQWTALLRQEQSKV